MVQNMSNMEVHLILKMDGMVTWVVSLCAYSYRILVDVHILYNNGSLFFVFHEGCSTLLEMNYDDAVVSLGVPSRLGVKHKTKRLKGQFALFNVGEKAYRLLAAENMYGLAPSGNYR